MTHILSKNFFYTSLISFSLLTSPSYADCPDKTVACTAVEQDGREVLIDDVIVNFKGVKVKSAGSFFTALADGFKCSPCVEGCGHTIGRAINDCNNKAKARGFKAGYINKKSLENFSLSKVANAIFDNAERAAKIGGNVAAAVATSGG